MPFILLLQVFELFLLLQFFFAVLPLIMIRQWRADRKQSGRERGGGGGGIGKSPRAGIRTWDARNVTALYVVALAH